MYCTLSEPSGTLHYLSFYFIFNSGREMCNFFALIPDSTIQRVLWEWLLLYRPLRCAVCPQGNKATHIQRALFCWLFAISHFFSVLSVLPTCRVLFFFFSATHPRLTFPLSAHIFNVTRQGKLRAGVSGNWSGDFLIIITVLFWEFLDVVGLLGWERLDKAIHLTLR